MKIKFLGCGSAFSMQNYQNNMMLSWEFHSYQCGVPESSRMMSEQLLVDCGTDIRFALADANLTHLDIRNVYISHLHADHIGGLEWLAFCSYFDPRYKGKPHLFLSEILVDPLWDSLKGGLGSIQGKIMKLDDYFVVNPVGVNSTFKIGWSRQEFQPIQVVHIMDGFAIKPSFGLYFKGPNYEIKDWPDSEEDEIVKIPGKRAFITTDTQFNPNQIRDFYGMADVIFQDCETYPWHSGVHAHYDELKTLPLDTKQKMWLCHYNDTVLPDAKKDGFLGFVKKGQEIEI